MRFGAEVGAESSGFRCSSGWVWGLKWVWVLGDEMVWFRSRRGRLLDDEDDVLEKVERGADEHMRLESVAEWEEKEKEFVGHVPLLDGKEIEKMVLEKKSVLLSKYASEDLLEEEREAKAILNIHR
ncbi:hypothetical protein Tco_0088156 [Tanacetum coccineum]